MFYRKLVSFVAVLAVALIACVGGIRDSKQTTKKRGRSV